uniref:Retrotransposon gag domain-containing protein n=1 Tax=Micrurus lemniscatus lemniscatus TaxID=129467 RepID=A0A2D4HQ32_MICLE
MTTPPNFPLFRLATKKWTSYINRFECILDATNLDDIPANRKKAYFLSFCGATLFDTATALLAPRTVKAVTWEELQEVLSNHYAPKPSRIARRHAFRRRSQAEDESISEYMAALRSAALQCSFRDHLDDMLLDQLVFIVRDLRLQRRLLAKGNIDLKQAIDEAQAAEMSNVSAAEIQKASLPSGKPSAAVHYEDTYFEGEDPEEEETINRLRNT